MPQAPESLSVLLIEDDEDDYVITRDLLAEQTRTRFDLEWVASYEEGLRAIQERRHDVYLIDYRLGEWTGLDLVRQAFTDKGQAPVIVLTGKANYEVDLEATLLGVTDFLEKGQLDTALLERSIRYAVGHHATLAELRQSQERYALAVRGANDGTWDWDLPSERVYLSPRWKGMLGYDDEAIGDSVKEWLDRVHPDDVGELRAAVDAHLEGASAAPGERAPRRSPRRQLPLGARPRRRDPRPAGQGHPRGRLDDRHHRAQGGRGAAAPRVAPRQPDGAAEPRAVPRPARALPGPRRAGARPPLRRAVPRRRPVQAGQRRLQPRGGRPAAGGAGQPAHRQPAAGRHRRPLRRRRVHRPPGRRRLRGRAARGGRADPGGAQPAVPRRRPRAGGQREHRHRREQAGQRAGGARPRRGHRDVRRQARGRRPLVGVQRADAQPRDEPAPPRGRAAPRDRREPAAGLLPADLRPADARAERVRGAGAVARHRRGRSRRPSSSRWPRRPA